MVRRQTDALSSPSPCELHYRFNMYQKTFQQLFLYIDIQDHKLLIYGFLLHVPQKHIPECSLVSTNSGSSQAPVYFEFFNHLKYPFFGFVLNLKWLYRSFKFINPLAQSNNGQIKIWPNFNANRHLS